MSPFVLRGDIITIDEMTVNNCFVLNKHAELNFYNASRLKQLSVHT